MRQQRPAAMEQGLFFSLTLFHQISVAQGLSLFPSMFSLNVVADPSDTYVSSEKYGVGLENVISMNISVEGFTGTIVSADEEIEWDFDTLAFYERVGGKQLDLVPKWIVIEPPVHFNVSSASLDNSSGCAAMIHGQSFFKFLHRSVALPLAARKNWECAAATLNIATRNPDMPLHRHESQWMVYVISNRTSLAEFERVDEPWKADETLITQGSWSGVFPLRREVCAVVGQWELSTYTEEECLTFTSQSFLDQTIRSQLSASGLSKSRVSHTCPGPTLSVIVAPLMQEDDGDAGYGKTVFPLIAANVSARITASVETLHFMLVSTGQSAGALTVLAEPAWTCETLSDRELMGNVQRFTWWVIFVVALVSLIVAIGACCCVSLSCANVVDEEMAQRSIMAGFFVLAINFMLQVVVGLLFSLVVSTVSVTLIHFFTSGVNSLPFLKRPSKRYVKYLLGAIELLLICPTVSVFQALRFAYDFVIIKAAVFFYCFYIPEIFCSWFDLQFDWELDLEWFWHLSWPSFIFTLPKWCFLTWDWDIGFGLPFGWMRVPFARAAMFLQSAFDFISQFDFGLLQWLQFGAPCQETLLWASGPFIWMAMFSLFFFTTQDLFLRLVPITIMAKHKAYGLGLLMPKIVAVFFTAMFAFLQVLSNTCGDLLLLGMQSDMTNRGTVLPSEYCQHTVGYPVKVVVTLQWAVSFLAFFVLFFFIMFGSAYQSAKVAEKVDKNAFDELADAYEEKLLTQKDIRKGYDKVLGILLDRSWIEREKEEIMKCCPCWFIRQMSEFLLVLFGLWAENHDYLADSVKSYSINARKAWCIQRTNEVLETHGGKPKKITDKKKDSELKQQHTENGVFDQKKYDEDVVRIVEPHDVEKQEEQKYLRIRLREMEAESDEAVVHVTARQLSLVLQANMLTVIPAKILEHFNQVILFDMAKSLNIHEQWGNNCWFIFLVPLWLSSIARLVCLLCLALGPVLGFLDYEDCQFWFSIGATTCVFSSFFDVISDWNKDMQFTSMVDELDEADDQAEEDGEENVL